MRLKPQEHDAICSSIYDLLKMTPSYKIFLFGSRVNDSLKGGDIDLAILVDEKNKLQIKMRDFEIISKIQSHPAIGERKIDLKIISQQDCENDPFIKSITSHWIELWPKNKHTKGDNKKCQ